MLDQPHNVTDPIACYRAGDHKARVASTWPPGQSGGCGIV